MGAPRLMIVLFAAAGIVVAAVVALALESWLLLGVVIAVHLVASAFVVALALGRASDRSDKPDAVTEAWVEEEFRRGGGRYPQPRTGIS